ncbi:GMC oxidoreductase [Bradyrhizobium pachyrhizi]
MHGIELLRIADVSIMPTIVFANTQAAVLMIAERQQTSCSNRELRY